MARLDKLKSLARELIKLKCVVEVIGNAVMCHLSVNPTSPTVTKVTKRWQALKWEERTPREKPSAGNIERIFLFRVWTLSISPRLMVSMSNFYCSLQVLTRT